ncbi:hypothetical protein C5F48_06835 [Cereibacter changlensis JA139]|uniref:Uncharacterized protein n=2 Tax=Cereibacter changlensis TaxID=402884 RepID=A0A2T4JX22_9RHOB|nr:hypothetical protein [Cereibacter changlensis]PTE22472.1 hypothetical protein C5F48_06835 [Cereibacter changlensis JA139]PZX48785.1 hypothetical protein LX76_04156 [Cereibacter changlensis]
MNDDFGKHATQVPRLVMEHYADLSPAGKAVFRKILDHVKSLTAEELASGECGDFEEVTGELSVELSDEDRITLLMLVNALKSEDSWSGRRLN